ncbi:MAG: aspartate kinase [Bacteroides sp.]|nr:aspartate kinase [Bacteroides sp.]
MKVLKFGGTSVGTVESLQNVKNIVENQTEPVIVVVSALGGLTDMLIRTARAAAVGDKIYQENVASIIERHHHIIDSLVPSSRRAELLPVVDSLLDELRNIFKGISLIRDLSPRSLDIIVSYGERLSSAIIARIIEGAKLLDSRYFIKTLNKHNRHVLDADLTDRLIHASFDELSDAPVIIVPGFISTDAAGDVTNLGRGGSDYTAAILAAALDAESLEIWTDVDGFLTADPRRVNGTHVIPHLSFVEAMDLCNFGAKVIYPPTIYPVFHKNIPIYIKNTFNPSAPGTCVSDLPESATSYYSIKGVSSIPDTCLITISGSSLTDEPAIRTKIFNTLGRQGVSLFLVSQDTPQSSLAFVIRSSEQEIAIKALSEEFRNEVQTGEISSIDVTPELATLAVVGDHILESNIDLSKTIQDQFRQQGIPVFASAIAATATNLSFVIKSSDERSALQFSHDTIFSI